MVGKDPRSSGHIIVGRGFYNWYYWVIGLILLIIGVDASVVAYIAG